MLTGLLCYQSDLTKQPIEGSGASADNSLRSAAEVLKSTLVNDGKRLEIRHFCLAACGSSIREGVFAGPKSLDAPEPSVCEALKPGGCGSFNYLTFSQVVDSLATNTKRSGVHRAS
jgi:hypothetical protein